MIKAIKKAAFVGAALTVITVASGFSSNDSDNIGLELNASADIVYEESAADVPSSETDENAGQESPEQDEVITVKPFWIFPHEV